MRRVWTVVSNSGQHAVFECGTQRIDIDKPKDAFARSMFLGITPGQTVDDGILQVLLNAKIPPKPEGK